MLRVAQAERRQRGRYLTASFRDAAESSVELGLGRDYTALTEKALVPRETTRGTPFSPNPVSTKFTGLLRIRQIDGRTVANVLRGAAWSPGSRRSKATTSAY